MVRLMMVGHAVVVMMMKGGLVHTCDGRCVHPVSLTAKLCK